MPRRKVNYVKYNWNGKLRYAYLLGQYLVDPAYERDFIERMRKLKQTAVCVGYMTNCFNYLGLVEGVAPSDVRRELFGCLSNGQALQEATVAME